MTPQITNTASTRWGVSIKLGVVGGIIWGLLFTAYYTMLPYTNISQELNAPIGGYMIMPHSMLPYLTISQEQRFTFAWQSATICFILMVIIILALPYIYNTIKNGAKKE